MSSSLDTLDIPIDVALALIDAFATPPGVAVPVADDPRARLVDTMMGAQDNDEMRRHADEICRLPVKGYGTTEFDMPEAKMRALIDGGFGTTVEHLRMRGLA